MVKLLLESTRELGGRRVDQSRLLVRRNAITEPPSSGSVSPSSSGPESKHYIRPFRRGGRPYGGECTAGLPTHLDQQTVTTSVTESRQPMLVLG